MSLTNPSGQSPAGAPGLEQDRSRAARSRSGLRSGLAPATAGQSRPRARLRPAAAAAIHVSLQAAADRRRGRLAPGRNLPLHAAPDRDRLLDRPRRCRPGQRLPDGIAGRPSRAAARAFLRDGDRMVTRVLDPTPWPDVEPAALEARRGTLVVLHGLLPHASAPNRSARARHAYALHLIDGRADYPSDNWLQRPGQPLRGFS